jgi:FixJ family two-component response regulator
MWKEIPAFSFSAGEREIMAHFVVGYPARRIATDVDISAARLDTSIAVFG